MGALLCVFLFFLWSLMVSSCRAAGEASPSVTSHQRGRAATRVTGMGSHGPSVHNRMGAPGWKCHPRGTPPCLILAPENALGEYSPPVKSPSPEHSWQPCLAPWGQPETCRRSSKWDTGDTGSTRASRARASQPPARFVLCSTHSTSVGLGAGRQHQQGGGEPGGTRGPLREPPLGAPLHG